MVSGAWIKCCQRENSVWEIRQTWTITRRLHIIFHCWDEVCKGDVWVTWWPQNQQWRTVRNKEEIVVTFQRGFIISRLWEMHAGIASILHKLQSEAASMLSFYLQLRVSFSFLTSSFWGVDIMSFLSRLLGYGLIDIIIFRSLNNVPKVQLHFGQIIPKGISKLTEILR